MSRLHRRRIDVFTVNVDGSGFRKLKHSDGTTDNGADGRSPDGTRIAFIDASARGDWNHTSGQWEDRGDDASGGVG